MTTITKPEGTDPRFIPLKTRFSTVKPKYSLQIFDNEFDPVNITRLYNDVAISRTQSSKYIGLGDKIKMIDDDATEHDIKGLAILIRSLGVYFQI